MLLYSVRYGSASTSMRRAFSPHTPMPLRRCRAPATLRAPDAPLWLGWIAARHAMSMAGTTALQDMMAELDGRRREARSTATRMGDLARARRAAVIAARLMGGTRAVHVRRVTLLLVGETALRRVRAAAAVAAANSGPIDTTGLL